MSGHGLLLAERFGATSEGRLPLPLLNEANQLDGFLAWVLVFVAFLVLADQVVLGLVGRHVTCWRTSGR